MPEEECRASGIVGDVFGGINEGVDTYSSVVAFEKVRDGLEGAVGELILVVKPEVTSWRHGSFNAEDYTSQISRLGVLTGIPRMEEDTKNIITPSSFEIYLPTAKHAYSPSYLKEGEMIFNCIDPNDVGISDSKKLENRISIYVGTRAIEEFVDIDAMAYFKIVNMLGENTSDEFYLKHRKRIKEGRDQFLEELRSKIIDELPDSVSSKKKEWTNVYDNVLGWGVGDRKIELDRGIPAVSVGEYVKGKL
jgi:hypothetical protein